MLPITGWRTPTGSESPCDRGAMTVVESLLPFAALQRLGTQSDRFRDR